MYKIKYGHIILLVFTFVIILFLGGCQDISHPSDPNGTPEVASKVKEYLKDCPDFFIPPVFGNESGTIKNQTGAVAWTPSGLTGNPPKVDSKQEYIEKIKNATRKDITQTNCNQYATVGYPGYFDDYYKVQVPTYELQAGFVCYALVYRAYKDANLFGNYPAPTSCNLITDNIHFSEVLNLSEAMVGDVVAFKWENDGGSIFDHVGILTKTDNNGTNAKNWEIVSSLGMVEIFKYGAKLTRLGVFGSTNGGNFISWPSSLENWSFKIFKYAE